MKSIRKLGYQVLLLGVLGTVSAEPRQWVERNGAEIQVRAVSASAESLLSELARKYPFDLTIRAPLEEKRNVSCIGTDLRPLLRCLLGADVSFMVEAASGGLSPQGKRRVIVLGPADRSSGSSRPTLAPGTPKVLPEDLKHLLGSSVPRRRAEGVYALISRGGLDPGVVFGALAKAAGDSNPDVRASALEGLASSADPRARSLVQQGLLDPSPPVRLAALDAMAIQGESRASFEWALKDPDPAVRDLAGSRLVLLLSAGAP